MDKDLLIGEIDGRKIYLTWKDVKEICNKAVRDENDQLRKFLEEFNALEVAEENKKLKELLKECREWIEFLGARMKSEKNPKNAMYFEVMLFKIDNIIGEDE